MKAREKILGLEGYPVASSRVLEIPDAELLPILSIPQAVRNMLPGMFGQLFRWEEYLVAERKDAIRPQGDPVAIELTPREWGL